MRQFIHVAGRGLAPPRTVAKQVHGSAEEEGLGVVHLLHVEPTRDLVPRALALSANLSVYDGCYVALAETLGCRLITADRRIAGAPGLPVEVVLV